MEGGISMYRRVHEKNFKITDEILLFEREKKK